MLLSGLFISSSSHKKICFFLSLSPSHKNLFDLCRKSSSLPLYSEAFTNYGMNKVMHITELFAAQFKFRVLPNVWTIHTPHRFSKYYQDFMQNLDQRLMNRVSRFKILERIILQYHIKLNECFIK